MNGRPKNADRSDKGLKDRVVDGGRIERTPAAQTIIAVAFLILVALISFSVAVLIGQYIGSTQVTYWMIELIFALLCGGAGALVGGSAVVRSTLKIPGSPVQATLGGAISMVIVGFALAYIASPSPEEQAYLLEIHNIPLSQQVDDVTYNVYVGSVENNHVSITRNANSAAIKMPFQAATYDIVIAVYKKDRDSSQILARCYLSFSSTEGPSPATMQIVPESDQRFRLYLARSYIPKVVRAWQVAKRVNENEPCVEGVVATKKTQRTLLSGSFSLHPNSAADRLWNLGHLAMLPRYAMLGSDISDVDPQDILPDLPPKTMHLPGGIVTSDAKPKIPAGSAPEFSIAPALKPPASSSARQVETPKTTAPPPPIRVSPATQALTAQVDAYIRGENLDRTRLYQSWAEVADYVAQGFRTESGKSSPLAARYLNLISNALIVIDNGKYLAPTRRPNWDQSTKPDRLMKSNNIPGFKPDDYEKVVVSLCSRDLDTRNAAQRLLRLYPAGRFYESIEALPKQQNFDKCDLAFVSESAIYYYYNRIVEYDGTFALDQNSREWLQGNYDDGMHWVTLVSTKDPKHNIFSSVLDYAYGLVLWDHSQKPSAVRYFNSMLKTVGSSDGIYPSNPEHLAVALREINEPGHTSKVAASATAYDPTEFHAVGVSYVSKSGSVALFALPEIGSKLVGRVSPSRMARIYLRADRWDFIQADNQIGWAQRITTSSGN